MRVLIFGSMLTAASLLTACAGGGSDTPLSPENSVTPTPAANTPTQRVSDGGTPPVLDQGDVPVRETDATPGRLDVGSPVPNVFSSQVINDPFLETLVSFPISQIVSGGPPKDGIPALTNPSTAASAGFLDSDDLVLGVVINGEAKAYPHNSGTYNQSQYTRYPYGDYRTNDNFLIFGLSPQLAANRNPAAHDFGAKDRVLGVRLNGEAKAYPFDKMGSRTVINDQVGGADIVVMWDQGTHLALPYARQVDGQTLTFEATEGGFPFNLKDIETGTLWNANGVAIEGPLAEAGAHLTQVPAHNSMWFAWVTFWQDTGVWSN